jgi:hypothetical protein
MLNVLKTIEKYGCQWHLRDFDKDEKVEGTSLTLGKILKVISHMICTHMSYHGYNPALSKCKCHN